MFEKISMLPVSIYLAVTGFATRLKNDERGLSGVVVAVLLILVAVLAVVLIWGLLGEAIAEWWEQIMNKSTELK
ncbi:MAG: hypothetical protein LBT59_12645 [Clostridiales bacterium]|jgi:Flp pilus assembly pilin Flp|nr:hypothetical protein [Clostridiales bacterium]